MADVVDTNTRSRMMAGIRGANTKPEITLRKLLHKAGLRYRLHVNNLPGRPDIVFRARRVAIFVHGCFWHRHAGCHWCTTPSTNVEFWDAKFDSNVERDRRHVEQLRASGWRVAIVWECALRGEAATLTAASLRDWIASDEPCFETGLVRQLREKNGM